MTGPDRKLFFLLPIPKEGGRALICGIETPGLASELESVGITVDSSIVNGAEYDLAVIGFENREERLFELLRKTRDVLAADGSVAICASNKWSYAAVFEALKSSDSRGYETISGMIREAEKHGLAVTDIYAVVPDFRNPSVAIPVRDGRAFEFVLSHFPDFSTRRSSIEKVVAKFLARSGLQRILSNRICVLMRRKESSSGNRSMLASLSSRDVGSSHIESMTAAIVTRVESESRAVVVFFFDRGERFPSLTAKIAGDVSQSEELKRECENLRSIGSILPADLRGSIPSVAEEGEWLGRFYYFQKFVRGRMLASVPGEKMFRIRSRSFERDFCRAWDWLLRFQGATLSGRERIANLGIDRSLYRYRLARAGRDNDCVSWIEENLHRLGERQVQICACHGDFFPGNILIERDSVKVIDWKYFQRRCHPCFDVATILSTTGSGKDRETRVDFERSSLESVLLGDTRESNFLCERFESFLAKNELERDIFFFLCSATLLELSIREFEETGICGERDASWRARLLGLFSMKDRVILAS